MEGRICKRCLLKELDKDAYFETVYEYIQSLDEAVKASAETYQQRLAFCQSCDCLINGMCKVCGCFVEVRAIKRDQSCPAVQKRW